MDNKLPLPSETPPPPPNYQPPKPVTDTPSVKPSFTKIIPFVVGAIFLVLIIFFTIKLIRKKPSKSPTTPIKITTLTYWGLWEPALVMQPLISAFEKDNPNIKINYVFQSHQDYQQRLDNALNSQSSPDIVNLHSSWLPLYITQLMPALANTVSPAQLSANFYPVVASALSPNNQVYGVPLTIEGLALFINSQMYQQASLQLPQTWEDLRNNAQKLTQRDPLTGKITRAGVALGTTSNISHWPDIVSLMLLQNGVNLLNPQSQSVIDALKFFVYFTQNDKVWDETLPESVSAFANEKVAMIIAPSWRAVEIQTLNPSLSWQTAPVPQLPGAPTVSWASIWFDAVPKNATHYKEAWQFLSFLSSAKAQQLLFESASKNRGVAQPPANKSVASLAQQNQLLKPFVDSLPTAKTFYTAALTHDQETGLNSRLIKYLEDAINSVAFGQEDSAVIDTLSQGFNQVLSQYKLVPSVPQPVQ